MKRSPGYLVVLLLALLACKKSDSPLPAASAAGAKPAASTGAAPATTAAKGERGTPAEAKAMLEKAIAHYKAVGRTQAFADFNAKKPPFFDRDLYVFCADASGKLTANGGYPQYVGTPLDEMRDVEGKSLGKAFRDAATPTAPGAVEYRWLNPISKKPEDKVGYVQKVDTDLCGVGAYNPR